MNSQVVNCKATNVSKRSSNFYSSEGPSPQRRKVEDTGYQVPLQANRGLRNESASLGKQPSGMLQSVFYINSSGSKMVVVGLDQNRHFLPFVQIRGGNGRGVNLQLHEWLGILSEVRMIASYIFDFDGVNPLDVVIGNHSVGVDVFVSTPVISITSVTNCREKVLLGQVTVQKLLKFYECIGHALKLLSDFYIKTQHSIHQWYDQWLEDCKLKFESKHNTAEMPCDSFIDDFVNNTCLNYYNADEHSKIYSFDTQRLFLELDSQVVSQDLKAKLAKLKNY